MESTFAPGESVNYWSVNKNGWFPTRVLRVDAGSGQLELELKPGSWVQPSLCQKLPGQPGQQQYQPQAQQGFAFQPAVRSVRGGNPVQSLSAPAAVQPASARGFTLGERVEFSAQGQVACPQGHALAAFATNAPGYTCDKCSTALPSGATMWGCRLCNYDICCQCCYVPATVVAQNPADGSVQLDCRPGVWISVQEQQQKIRRPGAQQQLPQVAAKPQAPAQVLEVQDLLRPGEQIEYYSSSYGKHVPARVVQVNISDGSFQIDVKPGVWLSRDEQQQKVRRVAQPQRQAVGLQDLAAQQVQYAAEKAGKNQVKRVDELTGEARDYYKYITVATNKGGEATMNYLKQRHWNNFDIDKDGRLNKAEIGQLVNHLYSRLSLAAPPQTLIDNVFSNHDLDGSGFIEPNEFDMLYDKLVRKSLASFRVIGKEELLRHAKHDFNESYTIGKRLAAGAQGVTYLATEKAGPNAGRSVVVKKPNDCTDTSDFYQLRDKAHPNIVRVFEVFTSALETFVVMECCSGGDLFKALEECNSKFGIITYNFMAGSLRQVMAGVAYIHSEFKECHNDIKPENVLLDRKPANPTDVPRCMIADFGCASSDGGGVDGDPRYNAPELWCGGCVSYSSDVWALGTMLFEMLSGGLLVFTDHRNISGWGAFVKTADGALYQKLTRAMQSGQQPNWQQIASAGPEAAQLCQSMLQTRSERRTSIAAALQNPWFSLGDANVEAKPVAEEQRQALHQRAGMCQMKMALLNIVASKMQGESLAYYQRIWDKFDVDHSGTLSDQEFMAMMQAPDIGMAPLRAQELHDLADLDGSGAVDFNEFVAVMFNPDELSSEKLEEHLRSIFYSLAGDDGALTCDEFQKVFPQEMGITITQLFQEIDKNNDGTVSFREFNAFLTTM